MRARLLSQKRQITSCPWSRTYGRAKSVHNMRYAYPMDRPMRYVTHARAHTRTRHPLGIRLSARCPDWAYQPDAVPSFTISYASQRVLWSFAISIQLYNGSPMYVRVCVYVRVYVPSSWPQPLNRVVSSLCRPCRSSRFASFIPFSPFHSPFFLSSSSPLFFFFLFSLFFFCRTLSARFVVDATCVTGESCVSIYTETGDQRNGDKFIHSFDESDTDRGWMNTGRVRAPIRHGARTTEHASATRTTFSAESQGSERGCTRIENLLKRLWPIHSPDGNRGLHEIGGISFCPLRWFLRENGFPDNGLPRQVSDLAKILRGSVISFVDIFVLNFGK